MAIKDKFLIGGNSNLSAKKSNGERTTRLAITLTVFGGAWFLLKELVKVWIGTFSTGVYTKTIISFEYLMLVIILTIVVAITLRVLSYIFSELKTYKAFESEEEKVNTQQKADLKYANIF